MYFIFLITLLNALAVIKTIPRSVKPLIVEGRMGTLAKPKWTTPVTVNPKTRDSGWVVYTSESSGGIKKALSSPGYNGLPGNDGDAKRDWVSEIFKVFHGEQK